MSPFPMKCLWVHSCSNKIFLLIGGSQHFYSYSVHWLSITKCFWYVINHEMNKIIKPQQFPCFLSIIHVPTEICGSFIYLRLVMSDVTSQLEHNRRFCIQCIVTLCSFQSVIYLHVSSQKINFNKHQSLNSADILEKSCDTLSKNWPCIQSKRQRVLWENWTVNHHCLDWKRKTQYFYTYEHCCYYNAFLLLSCIYFPREKKANKQYCHTNNRITEFDWWLFLDTCRWDTLSK